MHYLAPDTLEWEDSELGYTDWLSWALTDRLIQFYRDLRWEGWARETASVGGDSGLMVYPPLFCEETAIADRHRGMVPVEELWSLALDFGKQLRDLPAGTMIRFGVIP